MAAPLKKQGITDILVSPLDKDGVCRSAFDRITRSYLRQLVSDDLIEEHRQRPSGRHSEALGRILAYFRRLPPEHQYLLQRVDGGYRIVRMAVVRNGPIDRVGDEVFNPVEAGYHGIFLLKLKDMMEADNG